MGDMGCVLLGYVVVIVRELCERGEREEITRAQSMESVCRKTSGTKSDNIVYPARSTHAKQSPRARTHGRG